MSSTYEEMTVANNAIKVEVTKLAIEELELDPDNPRIQYRLSLQKDRDNLDDVILALPEVNELRKDIEGNGGVRERPYVQLNQQTKKYKVIEGNCRTVCVRDLHRKYTTNAAWNEMPVRIFPADMPEKLIAIFLSDQHVSGKIPWKSHEQAGQIYRMYHTHKMSIGEIARYLRITPGAVENFYKAYEFMVERFARIDNGKYAADGDRKFSYFYLAVIRKGIRETFERKENLKDDFCRWVGDNRFPKASDVSKLDKIIQYPESMETWQAGASLDDTMKVVERLDPATRKGPIFKSCAKLREVCLTVDLSTIADLANDGTGRTLVVDASNDLSRVVEMIDNYYSGRGLQQAAE